MQIQVRNYIRAAAADIECSPTCLLVGMNGSGKTSVVEAVRAALTGVAIAKRLDLDKKDVAKLLHVENYPTGARTDAARATVRDGDSEVTMRWPECTPSSTGATPPHASVFAAGVTSLDQLSEKERAAVMGRYLKADPTKVDLEAELRELRFGPESIEAIWKELEAKGWDSMVGTYETRRTDARRDWERCTKEKFGSDKSQHWHPDGWNDSLEDLDDDELQAQLRAAKANLESAIAAQAVDAAEVARLRTLAAQVEALSKKATEAEQIALQARTAHVNAMKARQELPAAPHSNTAGQLCPWDECARPLRVDEGGNIHKVEVMDDAKLKKLREDLATASGRLSNTSVASAQAERALGEAGAELKAAVEAQQKLTQIGAKEAGSAEAVDTARTKLAKIESDITIIAKNEEANRYYREWNRSDLLVGVMRPDGLRKKKLGQAIELFNSAVLGPLCEVADYEPVTLTEDLVPYYGGTIHTICSGGHLYRLRAVLQVAMARIDGSTLCVFDGADILDSDGRLGLFNLLSDDDVNLPALIGMTEINGARIPDLERLGLGKTYAMEDCRSKLYDFTQKEAA